MSAGKGKKLTKRQRDYAAGRAAGKSRAQAYIDAGMCPTGSRKTANDNAFTLETRSAASTAILHRIKQLQEQAENGAILDRKQRQAFLTGIVTDDGQKTDDRLRAADMLNRMSGDYTDRAQVTYSGGIALSYEERRQALIDSLSDASEPSECS